MNKTVFIVLCSFFASFFSLVLINSSDASAFPCLLKKVGAFEISGGQCAQTNNYGDWGTDLFGAGCSMGYNAKQFYKNSQCLPPTEAKWQDSPAAGASCKKKWSSNLLAICDMEQEGIYDSNVGACASASSCTNGVPQNVISCAANPIFNKVCSRAICGTAQVDEKCDGKAPGTKFADGSECSNTCKFIGNPFTFSISGPSTITVAKGETKTQTVTVTKTAGTTQDVELSCTGSSGSLPNGVSCGLSPFKCKPDSTCTSTLSVGASSGATTGTYEMKVTGTSSGATTQTKTFSLVVENKPFNFEVVPTSGAGTVKVGNPKSENIKVNYLQGDVESVSLSCASVSPSSSLTCSSVSFSPASCNPSCSSTMTIATTSSTPAVTYTIKIKGKSSSGVEREASYLLTASPDPFDFDLTLGSSSGFVSKGSTKTVTATATKTSGSAKPVSFSCSVPLGYDLGCTASPASCTPNDICSATITMSAASSTPVTVAGSPYKVTITASNSEAGTKSKTYDLTVVTSGGSAPASSCTYCATSDSGSWLCVDCSQGPYRFDMSVVPNNFEVAKGKSKAFTITLTKRDEEGRECSPSINFVKNYKSGELQPTGMTVSIPSCTISLSNPVCVLSAELKTTSETPIGKFDKNRIEAKCNVGSSFDEKSKKTGTLSVSVVPYEWGLTANPSSATLKKGESVTVNVQSSGVTGVPLLCLNMPSGVKCEFKSGTADISTGTWYWERYPSGLAASPAVSSGTMSIPSNDYLTKWDYEARQKVVVPPLQGRKLFVSFDYEISSSFGPCSPSVLFCSKCKTCSYNENSIPDSKAYFSASGKSSLTDELGIGTMTTTLSSLSCSTPGCTIDKGEYTASYNIFDNSGGNVGWLTKTRSEFWAWSWGCWPCVSVWYSGSVSSGWKTHTREITNLADANSPTELFFSIRNPNRLIFVNSKNLNVKNFRIWTEPGIAKTGSSPTQAVLTVDSSAAPGAYSLPFTGHNTLYWVETSTYNPTYGTFTINNLKSSDFSKSAPFTLTVEAETCNNNGICENFGFGNENQLLCPSDCKTNVLLVPSSLTPGQEITITVDFLDSRYEAGDHVELNLLIKSKKFASEQIVWDESNGCAYGNKRMSQSGSSPASIAWPAVTVSQEGRFVTTFTCTVPQEILSGDKTLIVTPTIY